MQPKRLEEMKKINAIQSEFKGNIQHLNKLLEALKNENIGIWNEWLRNSLSIVWIDLSGANLSNSDLTQIDLENAKLEDVNFENAFLYKANLRECSFNRANLKEAYLENVNLYKAEFYDADLTDSNLQLSTLTKARMKNVKLTGAKIFGWNITDIEMDNIECDYVYIDRNGLERLPTERIFKKGEFEEYIEKQIDSVTLLIKKIKQGRELNHVFISYVHEDYETIKRLTDELEANGISVWLDRKELQPGVRWEQAISDAIRNGIYFIACFSKN